MPGLGHVAISRHALAKAESLGITQAVLESTLREGSDTPDGFDIVLRELNNIRLVVLLKPEPFKGAISTRFAGFILFSLFYKPFIYFGLI